MCWKPAIFIFSALAVLASSGCSWLTTYKLDIRQGNYETVDKLDKVTVGMTKEQVRFNLGTPLMTDVFHSNRWDYIYRYRKGNQSLDEEIRYTVSIFFDEQNRVSKIEVPTDLPKPEDPVQFEIVAQPKAQDKKTAGSDGASPAVAVTQTAPESTSTVVAPAAETAEPALGASPADNLPGMGGSTTKIETPAPVSSDVKAGGVF